MTGQDFQDKLDALVVDLQTKGKGQTVQYGYRDPDGALAVLQLSSDSAGVVNAGELAAIQAVVDGLKTAADDFTTNHAPVQTANDAYKAAQIPHQTLMDAAKVSRDALGAALEADPTYQAAKTAVVAARQNQSYINASGNYKSANVSENFGNLSDAKGKYAI